MDGRRGAYNLYGECKLPSLNATLVVRVEYEVITPQVVRKRICVLARSFRWTKFEKPLNIAFEPMTEITMALVAAQFVMRASGPEPIPFWTLPPTSATDPAHPFFGYHRVVAWNSFVLQTLKMAGSANLGWIPTRTRS
jgi:hypothetical protein